MSNSLPAETTGSLSSDSDMFSTRRSFLVSAASPFVFSLASVRTYRAGAIRQMSAYELTRARNELLGLVNAGRMSYGASPLVIDDLACTVAEEHSLDMARRKFLSHWGSDGRKPYQRYADVEGFDAVQENVSAASNVESSSATYVGTTLAQMHMRMFGEVSPNDGHRRTILAPQHTHVGFGIALADRELRLVELYVGKHIHLEPYPRQAKPKATVQLRGKVLNPGYTLRYAEVFFEHPPTPPNIDWLRTPRQYSLPDDFKRIRPFLSDGPEYADGTRGEMDVDRNGRFRIPVKMYKQDPGIYTVVIWLGAKAVKHEFESTNICIHVD